MTIRVLLAADQELVRAGFRMNLDTQANIQVVGEAADGVEAVAATRRLRPEVVPMDIRMPNLDGLLAPSITRRVIEQFTRLPRPGGTDTLVGLTAREREVLKLVARGRPTPRSPRSWSSATPRSRAT